jgi:hypothetical protein
MTSLQAQHPYSVPALSRRVILWLKDCIERRPIARNAKGAEEK